MINIKRIAYVPTLETIEEYEDWNASISLLEEAYKNKKTEGYLVRLLLQCWYVINVVMTSDDYNTEQFDYISEKYIYYINCYFEEKNRNALSNLLIGYIISVIPIPLEPFNYWETKGKQLLELAYSINNKSPLFMKIYYGSKINVKVDIDNNSLTKEVYYVFPNNSAIECYFKDVLLSQDVIF